MYRLIGADGKDYGPVSADELREWIAQGRADGQTRVLPEGAAEWKPLATLPEFETALASATPPKLLTPEPVRPAPFIAEAVPARRTNPLATAGLICGIVSITIGLCCCYGFPFNLAGIVCSIIALVQISRDPGQEGKGFAIAGLITSILSLLLGALLVAFWGVMMTMPEAARHFPRL